MPVRVLGDETWKSVAIDGSKTVGVTESGELYWWGIRAANGDYTACPFPSPVGQSVVFDVKPAGGEDSYKAKGLKGEGSVVNSQRALVGIPEHGIHNAKCYPLDNFNVESGYYLYDYIMGSATYGDLHVKVSNEGIPADNRWFAPEEDALAKYFGAVGLGYTSPPAVEVLSIGQPLVEVSSRLVGPTSFTTVKNGGLARTSGGQWNVVSYLLGRSGGHSNRLGYSSGYVYGTGILIPSGFNALYSQWYTYTGTKTNYTIFTSAEDFDKDVFSATRSLYGESRRVSVYVEDGGSGYTSLNYSLTRQDMSKYDATQSTDDTTVNCPGSYYPTVTKRVITTSVSPLVTTKTVTYPVSVSPKKSGRALPTVNSHSIVGPVSVSTSGDGSGCKISTSERPYDDYSCLVSVSGNGMPEQLASLGSWGAAVTIGQSGELVLLQYALADITYTTPQYPDGITSLYSYSTARKGGDASVWEIFSNSSELSIARTIPLSLTVANTGDGYDFPATAVVSQQPGVAKADVTFDGKVQAIGVMRQGSGYTSPPVITLNAVGTGDVGTPGTATAVIAGPVDRVTVTNTGSGYRLPPRVVFSGTGISASATCELNFDGGVASVSILSGGRYRDVPPSVSFVPINQVESLSLVNGGNGYSSAPKVYLGGGGGSGASATCKIRAKVVEIELISGGVGYTKPPKVNISGGLGEGATATAVLASDGSVSSINLDGQGDFYQYPPTISIVATEGGVGAYAVARIAGYVDQVTLTARGRDYVNPPEVYFYDGEGGSGASATATIAAAGTGAQATAQLNGSIIFCKHNGDSSKLQSPPRVTVSTSTNPVLLDLKQRLDSGSITASEYETLSMPYAAYLKSSIVGKVTGVTITSGGSGYKSGTAGYDNQNAANTPSIDDLRIAAQAYILPTHCTDGTLYGYFGRFPPVGVAALSTAVSESGSVTSVTLNDSTKNLEFVKKPSVIFSDGIAATPYTCLTRSCAALRAANATTVTEDKNYKTRGLARWSGISVGGTRAAGTDATTPANVPTAVCVTGTIRGFGIETGKYVPSSAYYDLLLYDRDGAKFFYYDPVPEVVIEDERGTGATAKMATYTPTSESMKGVLVYGGDYSYPLSYNDAMVTAGGSGYTVSARMRLVGGSPFCWKQENKATATATLDGGFVSSISITSQGKGYNSVPDVLIYDGGGTGATAVATITAGMVASITVTSPGSGYTSTPKVAIVDKDTLFDATAKGKAVQSALDKYATPYLNTFTPEYCLQEGRVQQTVISSLDIISDYLGGSFVPFFDDNGYVEDIHWNVGEWFVYRTLAAAPTVTASVNESATPAQYSASLVSWSDVMSGNNLKKQ